MKKNKSTLMYLASILFYAVAILKTISSDGDTMHIVYMCLGSLWLCLASAAKLKENKKEDEGKIRTERLIIHTASSEEMEAFIALQTDEMLKAAYSEMLSESLKHPEQRQWYAMWMIELGDGTHVGELCFRGLNADGSVEIGYGISEEYRGRGYATEAVSAVTRWALSQPDVTRVEAETEADNIASINVLTKCGFTPTGTFGEEGPRFVCGRKTMKTYCGADCGACNFKENCPGCETTFGSPFGGKCIAAETVKAKGADAYREYKEQLKAEVNELLRMLGMPEAETLSELVGAFVNLEYTLPNGEKLKFLNDNSICLGTQIELPDKGICCGVVADRELILICTYGENCADPKLLLYKKR